MNLNDLPKSSEAIHAEQSVLGALLIDNEALYRIPDLQPEHFYRNDNREIFAEISRQIVAGKKCDVITVFDVLGSKVEDCLVYLNQLTQSVFTSSSVGRYSDMVIDRAMKRSMASLGGEMMELQGSPEDATVLVDRMAA